MRNPKFNIGEKVYHITPDSDQGVVLDCRYSMREGSWSYIVTFGAEKEALLYYEDELSTSKTF
ncbi:hypothetical protein [Proteiniphilum acetatigenes]|uniref:hypothetical protein n=1 Tax=Proteiniphilum acetatigenes TaxID=294710 RepID=UPI00037AED6B|nr:hypothetical protein [Proteiniphilum acetatigenes]